ncbi:hypothetical protein GWO43_24000 [candidate division KSB1 bacterium]|nr:hypothetical protein [candidate division KSB1 bacterium]NIR73334.1 hypothetical protein [candidate division KSB1 bacterium]NIS27040.1 hypothetical protein [candidate division KSB1 bacterium]NIT73880.1 hypothetical protein [candidate division KSB1 bacterium]NIU27785.1 hypothetical protein [candidate division KSB1 bacterium]
MRRNLQRLKPDVILVMKRHITLIPLIVLLAFSACQQPDNLTEAEKEEIRNDVRRMLTDYFKDINENGLMAEFKYLDNSSDFLWVPPGYSTWLSFDSVSAVLEKNESLYSSVENTWDIIRIDPLTHQYATYTGTLHGTWIDTTGKATNVSLIETGIVVKRKDGWKLLRGQTAALPEQAH